MGALSAKAHSWPPCWRPNVTPRCDRGRGQDPPRSAAPSHPYTYRPVLSLAPPPPAAPSTRTEALFLAATHPHPPDHPPPPTMYAFVGTSAAALSPARAAPATCVSSFAGARLIAAPRVRPARMSMALGEDGLAEDLSAAKGCIEEGCEINAVQVRGCVEAGEVVGGGSAAMARAVCVGAVTLEVGASLFSSQYSASAWIGRGRRTHRWLWRTRAILCALVVLSLFPWCPQSGSSH